MKEHVFAMYFGTPRRIERCNDGKRVLSSTQHGSISIIPAGQEALWDINGSIESLHLYVAPARLAALADETDLRISCELVDRTGFIDPVAGSLLALIANELETPGSLDALYAEQLSTLICIHLLRAHSSGASRSGHVSRGGLTAYRLGRVLAVMEERLGGDLTLGELAEVAGLSRYHFVRSFRQATGMTPFRCVVAFRTERAVALLQGSNLPLAEVALACGFAHQSHMSTWVRRLKGTTPSHIRADR